MNNIKTLELEILVTVMQNKMVPVSRFHKLFDYKWELYRLSFNDLKMGGLFRVANPGVGASGYELTPRGKARLNELLKERENEIEFRLTLLSKQKHPPGSQNLKNFFLRLIYHKYSPSPSTEIQNSTSKFEL
jgi:hypothetical protein